MLCSRFVIEVVCSSGSRNTPSVTIRPQRNNLDFRTPSTLRPSFPIPLIDNFARLYSRNLRSNRIPMPANFSDPTSRTSFHSMEIRPLACPAIRYALTALMKSFFINTFVNLFATCDVTVASFTTALMSPAQFLGIFFIFAFSSFSQRVAIPALSFAISSFACENELYPRRTPPWLVLVVVVVVFAVRVSLGDIIHEKDLYSCRQR
mmetsp:Transcript_35117/g.59475  ORF Transcript_35117/g.59475 Transcript_35117/m.59475 type:complete len:206 (-) Transcript_35117:240-857(-)